MSEIISRPAPLALAEVRRMCQSGHARVIRERADVSLRELAAQLGVDAATVSRWERGTQRPTGDAAIAYLALIRGLGRALASVDRTRIGGGTARL